MSTTRRRFIIDSFATAGLLAAVAGPKATLAQSASTTKPIRIVHGYSAGTNSDVVARLVGSALEETLGRSVLVEPMPGAAERIAARYIARQPADGHTLYLITGGANVISATDSQVGFDTLKDFSYISTISQFPFALFVPAGSPFRTLNDFLVAAKKEPGKYSYGINGVGNTLHLAMEYLKARTGIEIEIIPYQQLAQLIADTVGKRIDMAISTLTSFHGLLEAGQVRALALTSGKRWSLNPEIPTVSEYVPNFEVVSWLGLAAPAGLPDDVAARLATAVRDAMARPNIHERVRELQAEPVSSTPAEFRTRVETDYEKWKPLAKFLKR